MARRVFFSFHYSRDVRRVSQIRNSWVARPGDEAQPFMDKAEWEKLKRTSPKAIENWIELQLRGTSVTVILIGAETSNRPWVIHEIKRSHQLEKGLIGIYLNKVRDPVTGTDQRGSNPFDKLHLEQNGQKRLLSTIYPTYDWVDDDGYKNLPSWLEKAAKLAGY